MAKIFVAVIACLQVIALLYMAGQREYIRATGDIVYLRTAPLDPRDPLRGDYVRLRYSMNTLRSKHFADSDIVIDDKNRLHKDDILYIKFSQDDNGVASMAGLSLQQPDGLFIKGRVDNFWSHQDHHTANVRYGIEQYFVEQGAGLAMEAKMGNRNELQIPLEVEVALGSDGTAVTRGYRWSQLGIKTEVLAREQTEQNTGFQRNNRTVTSPQLKISIQNVSDQALTLIDNADHCAFTLEEEGWNATVYQPTSTICTDYQPRASEVIILKPAQSHEFIFDLSEPRWHIKVDGETKEIGHLGFSEQFRLIYHSPTVEAINVLNPDTKTWVGSLPSRAFYASGRID